MEVPFCIEQSNTGVVAFHFDVSHLGEDYVVTVTFYIHAFEFEW